MDCNDNDPDVNRNVVEDPCVDTIDMNSDGIPPDPADCVEDEDDDGGPPPEDMPGL